MKSFLNLDGIEQVLNNNDKTIIEYKSLQSNSNKVLAEEIYSDTNHTNPILRRFFDAKQNTIYTELFTQHKEENKYISTLRNGLRQIIGYRCYADDLMNIRNNLQYMTIYKNEVNGEWNIFEEELNYNNLNYYNIIKQCLQRKNRNIIGDSISGTTSERIIYNTIIKKINNNNNIVIYNNNIDKTSLQNGWFKDKNKKTLLKEFGLINTDNNNIVINDNYRNKLVLLPVSQNGHATTMVIDMHTENNNINDIKLGLFDSSFYHKLVFSDKVDKSVFGSELSKEIELLNKTDIDKDMSMFFNIDEIGMGK